MSPPPAARETTLEISDHDTAEVARLLDAREPQTVAETAVELATGLFDADIASLWWYLEGEGIRLVARSPELERPVTLPVEILPEAVTAGVGAAILVDRDTATEAFARWMEEEETAAALFLPMRLDDLGHWVMALGWREGGRPTTRPEELRRFADRLETVMLRAMERKMLEESALELADNVAQALVVSKAMLESGDVEAGVRAVSRALEHTQSIMSRLLKQDPNATMTRLYPSSVVAPDDGTEG